MSGFDERLDVALAQARLEGWGYGHFDTWTEDVDYLFQLCGGDLELGQAVLSAVTRDEQYARRRSTAEEPDTFDEKDVHELAESWPDAADRAMKEPHD